MLLSDSLINGATNQQLIVTSDGYYYVCVSDAPNCTDCSDSIFVSVSLPDSSNSNNYKLIISPNPIKQFLQITLNRKAVSKSIFSISTILGENLYQEINNNLTDYSIKTVELSFLSKGIYILEVILDGERTIMKFVKQ